jgi:predicted N-formylglutamate amidohydrolase
LALAKHLAEVLPSDFIQATISRLVIDCNRGLKHRTCFSEISRSLPEQDKQHIIQEYYLPYRNQVERAIQHQLEQGYQVWHLSIHSFTPVWNNQTRSTDIGLLYDPKRTVEKILAQRLKETLQDQKPLFKVRMNYPYQGIGDGLTTDLRKKYPPSHYLGLEIEINQALVSHPSTFEPLKQVLLASIQQLVKVGDNS